MPKNLVIHLAGTLNGAPLELRARGRLRAGAVDLALARRPALLAGDPGVLLLAASLPALAADAGLVAPLRGLPMVARARVDLLGDHAREVGTAVVVSTTNRARGGYACRAQVTRACLALEVGERLQLPEEVELAVGEGAVLHAAVPLTSTRGADLVADLTVRLWGAQRLADSD